MRFLEIGESILSPRNEHHFLGAAISGIFGTLQQSSANRANFRNTQTTNKFNMLYRDWETDRKSTRLNSSHSGESRMPSSA